MSLVRKTEKSFIRQAMSIHLCQFLGFWVIAIPLGQMAFLVANPHIVISYFAITRFSLGARLSL